MALWVCLDCATVYAVGLPACPQCGGTRYQPDWEEAEPATGGPSPEPGWFGTESEPEGGDLTSAGGSFSTSGPTHDKSSTPSPPGPPSPAPTAGSPSATPPPPTQEAE